MTIILTAMDIKQRFNELSKADQWGLKLILFFTVFGIIVNSVDVYTEAGLVKDVGVLLLTVIWLVAIAIIAYDVRRSGSRLYKYGFSFGWGGILSIAIVTVACVYKITQEGIAIPGNMLEYMIKTTGAAMEEIIIRVMAINIFIKVFQEIKSGVFWALLASAILFTLPHIPTHDTRFVIQLIPVSLILGFIYYKLRCNLILISLHVAANAGLFGVATVFIVYLFITTVDVSFLSRRQRLQVS